MNYLTIANIDGGRKGSTVSVAGLFRVLGMVAVPRLYCHHYSHSLIGMSPSYIHRSIGLVCEHA